MIEHLGNTKFEILECILVNVAELVARENFSQYTWNVLCEDFSMRLYNLFYDISLGVLHDVGCDTETIARSCCHQVLLLYIIVHVERCVYSYARGTHAKIQDVGVRTIMHEILKFNVNVLPF